MPSLNRRATFRLYHWRARVIAGMLDFTMDGEVQKHRKQRVAHAAADQTVRMALGSATGTQVFDLAVVESASRSVAQYSGLPAGLLMFCQAV